MMKTRIALFCLLLPLLAFTADVPRRQVLGTKRMDEVSTADGFAYFSGQLDEKKLSTDFPTIYFHEDGFGPTLTILANRMRADFSIDRMEEVFGIYRALVKAKAKQDTEAYDRLLYDLRNTTTNH